MLKTLLLTLMILATPILIDRGFDHYHYKYLPQSVLPVQFFGRTVATASKIVFKEKAYIITNRHVCMINGMPQEDMMVGGVMIPVISISDKHDLCVLGDADKFDVPSLKLVQDYSDQDDIFVMGFPKGLPLTVTKGKIVTSEVRDFPWIPEKLILCIMGSVIAHPGNSGSPVVNNTGEVIGILFAGRMDMANLAFIVPSSELIKFIVSLNE